MKDIDISSTLHLILDLDIQEDTCNVCNELKQKMSHAESENNPESDRIKQELEFDQRKTATFYKRNARQKVLPG